MLLSADPCLVLGKGWSVFGQRMSQRWGFATLLRDRSKTHRQPTVTCVNHGDTRWDSSATKSHGAVCTSSELPSSCLLVSSYDSRLWEFGHQFSYFPWFPIPLVHPVFLLSSWHLHQEASFSRQLEPNSYGSPKNTARGGRPWLRNQHLCKRSLPLAWSWLAMGRIVPNRNFRCYELEASWECVSTAVLQRCVTKPNHGVFSEEWQKAQPLHNSSYWEMWRCKFAAKEKVTRICQHARCASHSQKEQVF